MRSTEVRLSDVLTPVTRPVVVDTARSYRLLGVRWYGDGLFVKGERPGYELRARTLYEVREGDFVYNRLFAWKGSFAVAEPEHDGCFVSNEFPCFQASSDIEHDFLWAYFCQPSIWDQALALSTGSTPTSRNRLKEKTFLGLLIPLPPIDEQRRIAARIKNLRHKTARVRGLRRETHAEARAILAAAINEVATGLGKVHTALGEALIEPPRNGWSVRCDNDGAGVPVLTLSAVTGFRYDPRQIKRTSEPVNAGAHYWLEPGDLLITRSNTPELVGHAAIYSGEPAPCIYPDLIMRCRVDTSVADVRFVRFWLQSHPVREHMRHRAKGTSPSMKKIGQKDVMDIPFPCLTLDEQRRLVGYLEAIESKAEELAHIQTGTSRELDALMPSVLSEAFGREL